MNADFSVVVPNRYADIIQPLVRSVRQHYPNSYPRILIVANGHQNGYGFWRVDYPVSKDKFNFSKAVNLGINSFPDDDIILLNDDCVLLEDMFFHKLRDVAYEDEQIGILSPLIKGCVGNKLQRWHERERWWGPNQRFTDVHGKDPVCFPCVYLKRAMIKEIGPLNEMIQVITGYGGDDDEYCIRARRKNWKTTITSCLTIQHGNGGPELDEGYGKTWSTSFARK